MADDATTAAEKHSGDSRQRSRRGCGSRYREVFFFRYTHEQSESAGNIP
ncbi:MAG TPA: hypothetical protein VJ276_05350 [Thermoanaerobaculia bacterium]|nr:hypothetical protein [Thermoanaerobaculia bacterium]